MKSREIKIVVICAIIMFWMLVAGFFIKYIDLIIAENIKLHEVVMFGLIFVPATICMGICSKWLIETVTDAVRGDYDD